MAKIIKRFKVGDKVTLSNSGLENESYASFANEVLTVTHVATKHMKAEQFFSQGRPNGYHPCFDEGTSSALYDLKGQSVNCSLYDWELKPAR